MIAAKRFIFGFILSLALIVLLWPSVQSAQATAAP